MRVLLAAVAACVVGCALAYAPVRAEDVLTLDAAFARVDQAHPALRVFDGRRDIAAVAVERAALRPPLTLGADVEDIGGTGDTSGVRNAQVTLSLASVLERGGKLQARRVLAERRLDALAVQRETQRLDLLADAARRYLAAVAARRRQAVAEIDIGQRRRTVAAARLRLQAGASPESVVLTAEAALARAELTLAAAIRQEASARQHLAALWGERDPPWRTVDADPAGLPDIASFAELTEWLSRTPELQQFTGEQRIREARLRLARTQATADVDWQVGIRRLGDGGDVGLVGGVALPLGAAARARPDIREAELELASLEIEREAQALSLYSTLAEAHGRYLTAQLEAGRLADDVLPRLARAEAAAERAYRAGAVSYLEWAQLQSERTSALRQRLDAAIDAQRALIEIQRLTGQPFIAAPAEALNGDSP